MTDEEIATLRQLGATLSAFRLPNEAAVIVSFGTHASDYDCGAGSVSATITKTGETATASAAGTDLATALLLARGKCERQIEAATKAREKAAVEKSQRQAGERV